MKKIVLLIVLMFATALGMQARDQYAHDGSVLPPAAQQIIKNNFKAKVSVVKIEKEFGRVSEYDVVLDDGSEITFDRNGNWRDVETSARKSVPSGFLTPMMRDYIKRNHPKAKVVGIEKNRSGYDVELSDGVEMKFNVAGQFLRYD